MWNIQNVTNELTKQTNTFTNTDHKIVLTRGEEKWGEGELGKRCQIYSNGGKLDFVW